MNPNVNPKLVNDEIDVSVIIVAYNSGDCIVPCIQSVLDQRGPNVEVIVVDNHSTDRTVEILKTIGNGVRLFTNRENVGFGRACNQGVASSKGKLVMFLNPDAAFVTKDSLEKLRLAMSENPNWGLAGTRVTESDGIIECPPSLSYPKQDRTSRDFSTLPGNIAWVFGASMIVKRDIFDAAGGFDPEFFLTSEETDLCLRIREHGHEIGFVREVTVQHIGAASERGRDPYDTWRLRAPGLYRFWSKHYPKKDAGNLIRRDWLRSRYRQLAYRMVTCFLGNQSTAWQKYRRNKAIGDAAESFLRSAQKNSGLVPTGCPLSISPMNSE